MDSNHDRTSEEMWKPVFSLAEKGMLKDKGYSLMNKTGHGSFTESLG